MDNLHDKVVGLRDKDTNRVVAVYPYPLNGNDREIQEKVSSWFYQQSCSAEETLRNCYVDALNEKEIKEHGI